MDTPLSPSEIIETIKSLQDKKGESKVAISLIDATKDGLKKQEDKTPFDLMLDLDPDKPKDDTAPEEELTPVEQLILEAFRTLSKKQKVKIISGFLMSYKKEINKAVVPTEDETEKAEMFKLKTFFAKIVMVVAIACLFAIVGLFIYSVIVPSSAVPVTAVTGMFGMIEEIFKIVFTTPTH